MKALGFFNWGQVEVRIRKDPDLSGSVSLVPVLRHLKELIPVSLNSKFQISFFSGEWFPLFRDPKTFFLAVSVRMAMGAIK
jgi:hypothetical protein